MLHQMQIEHISRIYIIGPNGSKNCKEWFQLFVHLSLVEHSAIMKCFRPEILSMVG